MSESYKLDYRSDVWDNYVPSWISFCLWKFFGYHTYPKYPGLRTFWIWSAGEFKRIWIGGFPVHKDYIPAPTWRILWWDICDWFRRLKDED